jgi:small-conductance mechanosensitive channel
MSRVGRLLVLAVLVGGLTPQVAPVQGQTASPDTTGPAAVTARPSDSVDAALEARLRGIYQQVEAFRDLRVRVQEGVVHLEGTVLQPQHATDAADLARSLDGVLYVATDVSAQTDLADRVSPALARLQDYGTAFVEFLPIGGIALLVVLATLGVTRWIGQWEVPGPMQVSPLAWGLVRRVVQIGVAVVGLVVTFDLLGVTSLVGALLGTAGVAGLAVGFAFRDIIENYLAGVLLSLRQPFRVNDVVSIADHEGRVVRLTAREVVLLTFDGNHVRLPNATVFKSVLVNYTLNAQRLFYFDVGVGVEEDLTEVQRVGIDTLDAMKGVLADPPPFARVRELGDSAVVVRLHGWVDQEAADFHKVQSEALRLVKQAFDEADVEMPEPTYRLQLYQAGDAPPHVPKGPDRPVAEQAPTIDVEPDGRLERKVEEDLQTSSESNLLSRDG